MFLLYYNNLFFIAEERKRKVKLRYFEIMMKTVYLQCWYLIDLHSNSKEPVFPGQKLKGIIAKHFLQHFSHVTQIWKEQRRKQNLLQEFIHACFFIRKLQWTVSISNLQGLTNFFEIEKITVKVNIFTNKAREVNKGLLGMY